MSIAIPEGYDLIPGRGHKNAVKALELAEERGYPTSAVLTTGDGYLIPLSGEQKAELAKEQKAAEKAAKKAAKPGPTSTEPPKSEEILTAEVVEVELPKVTDKVADFEAFANEHNIDLGDAKNNEQRLAAIEAEIERRTKEAEETGVLTAGSETPAGDTTGEQTPKED